MELVGPFYHLRISRGAIREGRPSPNELDLEIRVHKTMDKKFLLLIKYFVKDMLLGQPEWTKKQVLSDDRERTVR